MNKKGASAGWIAFAVIFGFLLVAGVLFFTLGGTNQGIQTEEEKLTATQNCGGSDPVITLSMYDAILKGDSVTPNSIDAKIVGADGVESSIASITSGTTKFAYGDKVTLLVGKPGYLNTTVDAGTMKCGSNGLTGYIYNTADSSIQVKNDAGQVVTDINDATSTVNQTASATPVNMEVKFTANMNEFSGDMVVVIESANTTEIADIVLSGATKVSVPSFYTVAGAGSYAVAYEVPGLKDGDSKTYNLQLTPESGETMGGQRNAFYLTAYTKQWFKDTSGNFVYGIEDPEASGTAKLKYADDFDYDWNVD